MIIGVGLYFLYREHSQFYKTIEIYKTKVTEAQSIAELEALRKDFNEWASHHCWCPQYVDDAREVSFDICKSITSVRFKTKKDIAT